MQRGAEAERIAHMDTNPCVDGGRVPEVDTLGPAIWPRLLQRGAGLPRPDAMRSGGSEKLWVEGEEEYYSGARSVETDGDRRRGKTVRAAARN